MLHLDPHVAFTCLAFLSWFVGEVITQQSTRTLDDSSLATISSSWKEIFKKKINKYW